MENYKNKSTPNKLSDDIDSKAEAEKINQEVSEIIIPNAEEINKEPKFDDRNELTSFSKGEEIDINTISNPESNVTDQEIEDLRISANDMPGDDEELRAAALDSTDDEGVPLNVGSFDRNISGSDLDVPGAELDNEDENIGNEDEENNEYSLGGDDHPDN